MFHIYGPILSNSSEVWTMCRADETRLLSDEMQFGTVTHFFRSNGKITKFAGKIFHSEAPNIVYISCYTISPLC
jgi:hypothetical protein